MRRYYYSENYGRIIVEWDITRNGKSNESISKSGKFDIAALEKARRRLEI
jgi:hypothetical protein